MRGFVRYPLLFVPVWWIWILFTFYADRFDTDDVVYRLLGMLGMAAIIAMGITLPGAMADGSAARLDAPFVASYLAARWVTFLLYLRAARIPYGRRLVWIHGTTSVISSLIWLGSLLVPAPERYALWVAALAIELGAPLVGRRTIAAVPVTLDHLPERVGLFTIIVLGESVVAVATGLGDVGWACARRWSRWPRSVWPAASGGSTSTSPIPVRCAGDSAPGRSTSTATSRSSPV